jgi:site-specific recombinase XerD
MPSNQDDIILTKFEEALNQMALSSSTIVNYLADLRAFERWGKGEVVAEFILLQTTPEHIRQYRNYLSQKLSRAASTVNRHLMALRKFFAFAVELGLIAQNPTNGVSLVQDNGQAASRPLTKEEIENLLSAAQNGSRAGLIRRDVAILQLLLNTGLRVSEIVNLKREDLTFNDPGVLLHVCDLHDEDKVRRLPLSGQVCKALNDYLQVRPKTATIDHLFLSQDGRPISKRTVQRVISNCAKAVGIEGVSAQSMRRTYAVHLFLETQDLALVSERLGHQNCNITEQFLSVHKTHLFI